MSPAAGRPSPWRRLTLTQRLAAVFAVLLLACSGASAWLQVRANAMHDAQTAQRLSMGLAQHIADTSQLMDAAGLRREAVRELFDKLMAVNPNVEVYLVAPDGRIVGDATPRGHMLRDRIDIEPVRRLLAGDPLPIYGDDPRSLAGRKVFNAAPLRVDGQPHGYVYVVLQSEARDMLAADVAVSSVLGTTLWAIALVALLCLLAGLAAFNLITRPLRRLTATLRDFDGDDAAVASALASPAGQAAAGSRDEIAILEQTFHQMAARMAEQWRELTRQDQQRRELVANISHDLRTPLTSLHGYLETLLLKEQALSPEERRRYLEVALDQSRKVGRLAQALFELARLESGLIQPDTEAFSLPELIQDVFQKFELQAEARRVRLTARLDQDLPMVRADLGMIERVLTNLLDNALRHSPAGGGVEVAVRRSGARVEVRVADQGPGVAEALRETLFTRASVWSHAGPERGGLGLLTVRRILQLHGDDIVLAQQQGAGATFVFGLPVDLPTVDTTSMRVTPGRLVG
ncbi:sensor histidine kinase [Achromobacter aloeverae]|uniref:histidine kinase n=1 Tax=Achromobacter aloeverae TaxID=1750518 RepID=A0A4Q1HQZ7_9BURK|nr:HAMP domain-containing sensor histidine kinase [Achromobacter aloeverae]RXN93267.1 two-component sensor histidine kinase [Achromobacter aloeverae]